MDGRQATEESALDQFYQSFDLYLKLFGAEELGKRNVFIRLARMGTHARIDYAEIQRVLRRVTDLNSWYGSCAQSAAEFEAMAEAAAQRGNLVTAGEAYLRASLLYHFGQLMLRTGNPRKDEGRTKRIQCYRKGSGYCDPPAVPVEIPFDDVRLPGYLRLPRGVEKPPCVMILDGADSVKEEYHSWTDELLKRGMATLTFDGPGQGEMSTRFGGPPLRIDAYERVISAAIDVLERRPELDSSRVGAWGVSLGGFLAARAAAFDRRLKAAVSLGGFYDFADFARWPVTIQMNVVDCLGLDSLEETKEVLRRAATLRGIAERIQCPFLVVHGGKDDLVTLEESRRLAEGAGTRGELVVLEDAVHVCLDRNLILPGLIGDWIRERVTSA